jgi:hypothetical protein
MDNKDQLTLEDIDLTAAMKAAAEKSNAFRGFGRQNKKAARHGTHSGYIRHRQTGQEACDACLEAHAAYGRGELKSSQTFAEKEAEEEDARNNQ